MSANKWSTRWQVCETLRRKVNKSVNLQMAMTYRSKRDTRQCCTRSSINTKYHKASRSQKSQLPTLQIMDKPVDKPVEKPVDKPIESILSGSRCLGRTNCVTTSNEREHVLYTEIWVNITESKHQHTRSSHWHGVGWVSKHCGPSK